MRVWFGVIQDAGGAGFGVPGVPETSGRVSFLRKFPNPLDPVGRFIRIWDSENTKIGEQNHGKSKIVVGRWPPSGFYSLALRMSRGKHRFISRFSE